MLFRSGVRGNFAGGAVGQMVQFRPVRVTLQPLHKLVHVGRHGGFGLAIVRSLAEQMGGTVGCDSRPGGTVFTLTLPV